MVRDLFSLNSHSFFFPTLPFTVNIQNFESLSPALSRSNSLRIKKDTAKEDTKKITTGTRLLKAHELTYFGVKSSPITTTNATDSNTNKSPFMHLSTNNNKSNNISSSIKSTITTTTNVNASSKITASHQKPDLIMHHQHKYDQQQQQPPPPPELTPSEKKLMIETLDNCIDETNNLEPLYENLYQNSSSGKQQYDRKLDLARDEKILDELTRAADEIMNVSITFILFSLRSMLLQRCGEGTYQWHVISLARSLFT
jgi:hypothetical protein